MCFGFLLSAYIAIYNANEILQDVENDATNRLDENNYLGHTGLFCVMRDHTAPPPPPPPPHPPPPPPQKKKNDKFRGAQYGQV